jgi:hypothetical protein
MRSARIISAATVMKGQAGDPVGAAIVSDTVTPRA